MAIGTFADLSRYQQAAAQPVANPLESLIQGFQQGQAIQQLPQIMQAQRDAQVLQQIQTQLAAATAQQQLQDLANPEAALLRKAKEQLMVKAIDPSSGVISSPVGLENEVIATPAALTPEQQVALTTQGVAPNTTPGAPILPFLVGGRPTGFSQDIQSAVANTEALSRAKGTTSLERQMLANEQARARLLSEEQRARESNASKEKIADKKSGAKGLTAGQKANFRVRGARALVDINQFTDPETGVVDWDSFINKTGEAEGSVLNANNVIKAARAAAASNKTTLDEKNFQLYGNRMKQANDNFDLLEKRGFDPTSLGREGLLGGWSPNLLKTNERQEFEQAERNFINATLRRESGAVITDDEFANARQQYLPQPGDGEGVLIQKAANRKLVVDEFKRLGGQNSPSSQPPPATSGSTTPLPAGSIQRGRFIIGPPVTPK